MLTIIDEDSNTNSNATPVRLSSFPAGRCSRLAESDDSLLLSDSDGNGIVNNTLWYYSCEHHSNITDDYELTQVDIPSSTRRQLGFRYIMGACILDSVALLIVFLIFYWQWWSAWAWHQAACLRDSTTEIHRWENFANSTRSRDALKARCVRRS